MVQKIFTISKIFPLTSLRTLIPKIQPLSLSLPRGQKVYEGGGLEENFSEKTKKDRDRRQKCGRSLARSLPDSHGQPGYFAVFLNSHPTQLSAPGYFRASYSHSQKILFLRDMKPLGLFVLPLYHRGAFFAMNSARTKPVLYPNDTQLKPNKREYTPKLFRRTFRRMEYGRAFALCQRRAGIVLILSLIHI